MKNSCIILAAAAIVSSVTAFPRMSAEQLKTYSEHVKKDDKAECPFSKRQAEKRASKFVPSEQLVDVTGEHAFVPPNFDAGDQRGPCPGLNALANHGYLPHNGVADIPTIIDATHEAYGMSLDLGGFLAVFGTVFDGNPLSTDPGYSIGGPSPNSQNILGGLGLLGTPTGLSGSHNKYESDVSATRGDLYLTGNNYHVVKERFIDYYNALKVDTPADEQYSALLPFHAQRFDESINTNPYFFYSPFAGILVSPAAYSFPPAMMANHSDEYPDGYLDRATFASFFGVQGDSPDNFVVNQGWERIPDNWYKRPLGDDFSIPDFLVDVVEHAAGYPRLLDIGGNTGKTNSFFAVDIANLTGGVFAAEDLLNSNNLECFVLQIIMAAAPDLLGTTFTDVKSALQPLADKVQTLLAGKGCPQLTKYNQALFDQYPGYTEKYGGYEGKPPSSGQNGLLGLHL